MIPDPLEIIESHQEILCDEWNSVQKNVPQGSFRCPYCLNVHSYEPIQSGPNPDSPAMCYDCLPIDVKEAYDQFCK